MRNQTKKSMLWLITGGLALLAVASFNMSSGCRCSSSIEHLGDIPLYGWILLALNLAAFTAFLLLRQHNRAKPSALSCLSCQARLRADWPFCPSCGTKTSSE